MNDNQKTNRVRVVNGRDAVIYDLLRSLEWCIKEYDGDYECFVCPACRCRQQKGHSGDCAMAAAIEMYRQIVEGERDGDNH